MKNAINIDRVEERAIDAAMKSRWDEAIELNTEILKVDKRNLAALLRLGFSYFQKGNVLKAREFYQKALRIQPGNLLARDNLDRLKILGVRSSKKAANKTISFNPSLFLEYPGATKSVAVVNIGQKQIVASLMIGEEVTLKPKRIKIEVRTKANEYIGSLPDDLSKRLLLLLKAGSSYNTYIKEVSLSRVVVFIREEKKGKKVQHFTSFPKDMQKNITRLEHIEDETGERAEEDTEGEHDLDIERMAETLHEEKDFSHYTGDHGPSDEDEENIEE